MESRKKSKSVSSTKKGRLAHEAEGSASGALVGAVLGASAGPPGIVAGAIIGAVAGAVTGAALDTEASREEAHSRELDAEIGISGGDLGAPNLAHPPAKIGGYSVASVDVGSSSGGEPTATDSPPKPLPRLR